ncbi:MAG: hypothetical protein RSF40_01875 [Oscillospiraceae bacterium]
MGTPFKTPIERFLRRIEEDIDFFEYNGVSPEQALIIAKERSKYILLDAVALMDIKSNPDIVFSNCNEISEIFNEDWTQTELSIVVGLMYQLYLDKDIPKLKLMNVNYTSSELRVLDPSNARKSFMEMYEFVCAQNDGYIDEYRNKDRLTGKYKTVDFAAYDDV